MQIYNKRSLLYLGFIWFFPVLIFSLSPNYSPSPIPVWIAFFLSILLVYFDERVIVAMIPFMAFISPLTGPNNFLPILPSEFYILICFIVGAFFLLLKKEIKVTLLKGDYLLVTLLLITVFSFFFSFEAINLFKSITSIVMIMTIFLLTRSFIDSKKDIEYLLVAFVLSSIFACIISISSLIAQVNLSSFIEGTEASVNFEALYTRASFFYANVGYVLGLAFIISLINSISSKGIARISYLISSFLLISCLILMIEKTSLLALAIALVCLWTISSINKNFINIIASFMSIVLVLLVTYVYAASFAQDVNFEVRFQIGGFYERLCVASSTTEVFLNNPSRLFFGFGPDASIMLNNANTTAAKMNCMGYSEGAIDNGFLSYLFDYGFLFVLAFIAFIAYSIINLFSILSGKKEDSRKILLISITALIFISLSLLSDVLSTGKIAWIIFQFFALVGIIINVSEDIKAVRKNDTNSREVDLSAQ